MRRIRLGACLALVGCCVAAGAADSPALLLTDGSSRPSELDRLVSLQAPLTCGGGHARVVALTFDDGPGPYTERLLDLLQRWHAAATFFLVADRISEWPNLPAKETALGAIGDHTWSHPRLPLLPYRAAVWEIEGARSALAAASHTRIDLFRPPYGLLTPKLQRLVFAKKMLDVRWSVDSRDYALSSPASIARNVERAVRPGSIVLLHDIHAPTVAAVGRILPALARRHLRSVTIPQLLVVDPPQLRGRSLVCGSNAAPLRD